MVHMRIRQAGPDLFSQLTPFSTDSVRNREPGQAAGGPVQQLAAATRPASIGSSDRNDPAACANDLC